MNPFLSSHLEDPIPVAGIGAQAELRGSVLARAHRLHALTRAAFPQWAPPPFDPVTMAEALGIPVHYAGTPRGCHAMLIPDTRTGFLIVCDKKMRSEGRIRFSVAHELVHTFFDDAARVVQMRSQARLHPEDAAGLRLERLCDAGAAELLMPENAFRAALGEFGLRAAVVPELSRHFEVSLHAAAIRLLDCAGDDLHAVGFFDFAPRPSAPGRGAQEVFETSTYRVRRVFARPGRPYLFPTGKSVSEDSVIYRCSLGFDELEATEEFRLGHEGARFRVKAFPMNMGARIEAPPLVIALLLAA